MIASAADTGPRRDATLASNPRRQAVPMPRLLFFPHRAPALVAWLEKAYIHGHYRLSPKTHARVWVDSYSDKRPERGRTTFTDWAARKAHFDHHLGHARQRVALHAFHDLSHDDAHQLAGELGLHAGEKHASKKDLMEAVHGKLTDKRQALQSALVATERAKWAEKKAAGTVGNKPVKVIRLTGDEFGAGLAGKSLRDAAVSYAKKHFVDAAFENASTGQSIEVTWQSVKHALANANDAEMRVFHALPRILKTARYVESVPDKLGRPDIQAVHRYAVKVLLKDEPLTIGVIVRETKDGHRFYDHFIIKSKNPAGISEAAPPAGVLGDQPTAGLAGNSVDPQTSDDKGDKSHKGNDDGQDSASQTSAIRGTGAQARGQDSARQPNHWDALEGKYSAGVVDALRKRASDNAWSPEFVGTLTETLGGLPAEMRGFFDYRAAIGHDALIVHRTSYEGVPDHMRGAYESAAALTVNGMRIEFIEGMRPTPSSADQ